MTDVLPEGVEAWRERLANPTGLKGFCISADLQTGRQERFATVVVRQDDLRQALDSNARLAGEVEELRAAATSDGRSVFIEQRNAYRARAQAAEEQREAMAEAVAPFVKAAQFIKGWPADYPDDDYCAIDKDEAFDAISIGDWRRLAALSSSPVGGGSGE